MTERVVTNVGPVFGVRHTTRCPHCGVILRRSAAGAYVDFEKQVSSLVCAACALRFQHELDQRRAG